jgi:DNA primase
LYESPVDILAHATIHKMGQTEWDGFRLSLGGVSSAALNRFLERHPNITSIQIALDNDKAGIDATNRIVMEVLSDKRYAHIKISVTPPPIGKDYADTLKAITQNSINKATISRPKEAVF